MASVGEVCDHWSEPGACRIEGCVNAPQIRDDDPSDVIWFTAKFNSECPSCGDEILEGTRAGIVDGRAACYSCARQA